MSSIKYQINAEIHAEGLFCPEPVMLLHNAMRDAADGDVILLRATDVSTTRDVPKFCSFLNHTLLAHEQQGELFIYYIRKRS